MLLEDLQDIDIGEKIISAGNGLVKSADDISSGLTVIHVLGIAEEALDLSGSPTGNELLAVRVV